MKSILFGKHTRLFLILAGCLMGWARPGLCHWDVSFKANGTVMNGGVATPWSPNTTYPQFKNEYDTVGWGVYGAPVSSTGSVTATLKWTYDPTLMDDTVLPPLKIYIREESYVGANDCTASTGDNGLGDPCVSYETSGGSGGTHILIIDNPSRATTITLPTRHQSASGISMGGQYTQADTTYRVTPLFFRIQTSKQQSFPYLFTLNSSANVAAGGKDSNEHLVTLVISAYYYVSYSWGDYTYEVPISGIAITPAITQGGGTGAGAAKITMDSAVTDANGSITGTFRSGNITQSATVQIFGAWQVTINQMWAGPGNLQYSPSFQYEQPAPITFRPTFYDFVPGDANYAPITSHKMDFKVTKVGYRVWDESVGNYKDATTTDPDIMAAVATFSPATGVGDNAMPNTTKRDGTYSTQLTVHQTDKAVSGVYFDVEDEDVFKPY